MPPDTPSLSFDIHLADVLQHSFRDFHAKGLDYICLNRSPTETIKLFILDGDAAKLKAVVNPHDHRYAFTTHVLAGKMVNHTYTPNPNGDAYDAFDYITPLNGGTGFQYRATEHLSKTISDQLNCGQSLHSPFGAIHTIQMQADQTILYIRQFEDIMQPGMPTSCWTQSGQCAPDTSGLYTKFDEDMLRQTLNLISSLADIQFKVQ